MTLREQRAVVPRVAAASARDRSGGVAGNERLTAATAAVLVALLAVEGVTIVFLRPLLSVHLFVGMLLVPPVVLKLGSVGWRFGRYYTGSAAYRRKGPPHPLLRILGAPVVLATVGLFASGIALLALGPHTRYVLALHKVSFVVWFVATGLHVLAHLRRVPRLAAADWRRRARLEGGALRRRALVAALALGVVLALSTVPLFGPWLGFVR